MKRLTLTSLGQIPEADISFGDLTVLVGEQASGKSILLQLVLIFIRMVLNLIVINRNKVYRHENAFLLCPFCLTFIA